MNSADRQYLELLNKILYFGINQEDRTGTGTLSIFAEKLEFNLAEGFPLLTTKDVWYKGVLHELLWFLQGDTNIKYLVDNKVNIWNEWAYTRYNNFANGIRTNMLYQLINKPKKDYYNNFLFTLSKYKDTAEAKEKCPILTQEEFIEKIKTDLDFSQFWGDLGPIYGSQWTNWNGIKINQLQNAINLLTTDPDSRRIIVSAWNPERMNEMALDPCHMFFQFYSKDTGNGKRKLSMYWVQRSADVFLGIPYNIASYATLLMMIAQVTNHEPDKLYAFLGNTHLYKNHIEQATLQSEREPYPLPTLTLNPNINNIFDFKFNDFILNNYLRHPKIHASISV